MQHFRGLEGARGWLAGTVVLSHTLMYTGLYSRWNPLRHAAQLADTAVMVFIVISGFVISHLIIERREPYGPYLVRRFMRLYPAYIVCLACGFFTLQRYFEMLNREPWGVGPTTRQIAEQQSFYGVRMPEHILAHLTMLHGTVPNNVLFESEYAYLSPAWSLSLEWQFYIVALVVVGVAMRKPLVAVGLAAVLTLAYRAGVFGSFILPSSLPGAAIPFAIGIACRLSISWIKPFPLWGALLVAMFAPLYVGAWAIIFSYITSENRLLRPLLDSRLANWFGDRSYATYVAHVPIIQLIVVLCAGFGYWTMILILATATPILVIAASSALHQLIEKPGMAAGRSLAQLMLRKRLSPAGQ